MQPGSPRWCRLIAANAAVFDLHLTDAHAGQLARHARELITWNRKINLTAITDPLEMAVKHYLDAVAPQKWLPLNSRLLDIGAGAGFPGIPLSVVRPDLTVDLIDSVRKKISFIRHTIRLLKLEHATAHHGRCETLGVAKELQQTFDVVISRAFAEAGTFIEAAYPYLKDGGLIVAMKGRRQEALSELAAVNLTTGANTLHRQDGTLDVHVAVETFNLPVLDLERTLVLLGVLRR